MIERGLPNDEVLRHNEKTGWTFGMTASPEGSTVFFCDFTTPDGRERTWLSLRFYNLVDCVAEDSRAAAQWLLGIEDIALNHAIMDELAPHLFGSLVQVVPAIEMKGADDFTNVGIQIDLNHPDYIIDSELLIKLGWSDPVASDLTTTTFAFHEFQG